MEWTARVMRTSILRKRPLGQYGTKYSSVRSLIQRHICLLCYRLLHTYTSVCNGQFSAEEKQQLRLFFDQQLGMRGEATLCERWGLSAEDMNDLRRALL